MGGICGVLVPVIELLNKIDDKISLRNEIDGKMIHGAYRFPVLEANETVEVDKMKVKDYWHKVEGKVWKIHVLLNGKETGLYLDPSHLLGNAQIIFEYKVVEATDITLLCARSLIEESWIAQLRGFGFLRKHKYGKTLEKFGLQDIAEVRVQVSEINERRTGTNDKENNNALEKGAGSQTGVCDSPHNVSKLSDVSSEEVAISNAKPNTKEKVDCTLLDYHQPSTINGIPVASIPTIEVQPDIELWKYAIVAYFVGKVTQDHNVESYVKEHWSNFGYFKIHKLKHGFYLFNFKDDADKFKVLNHQQFIENMPLILKMWKPKMSLDSLEFLATVPVWVRFPSLDLQFWSPTSLGKISSLIGKPLFADKLTTNKERLDYARVCIEIKVGDKLPKVVCIWMDDNDTILEQEVQYEWKPQPCGYCFSLIHDSSECLLTTSNDGFSTMEGEDGLKISVEDKGTIREKDAEYNWKPQPWSYFFSTSNDHDTSSINETSVDDESYETNQSEDYMFDDHVSDLTADSHDGNSDIVEVNSDAENIFIIESSATDTIESQMDIGDEFENEVYYTPPSCLKKKKKKSSMK